MKLRAPRCNEGRLATSLSAGRAQPAWPPSLAEAAPAPSNSAATVTNAYLLVSIVGHSIGNRSVAVGLGHERQQDEEAEIQRREDARQQHVDAVGGLEAEPHEHHEGHEERAEQQ